MENDVNKNADTFSEGKKKKLQGCLPSCLTCRKLKIPVDVIFYSLQIFVGITWTCREDNKPLRPVPTL